MRLLLDTHVFIWWILDDPRLSDKIRTVIDNSQNRLYLSSASTWEIVIKTQSGKLKLPESPEVFVAKQIKINAIDPLPITIEHTLNLLLLPPIHKDPFDRMLIAQTNMKS